MLQNLGMLDLWEVVGFFTGLAIFFNGFRIYREYRLLADTPEIPIRSIPMGLVHICGKARGVEPVPSPISLTRRVTFIKLKSKSGKLQLTTKAENGCLTGQTRAV